MRNSTVALVQRLTAVTFVQFVILGSNFLYFFGCSLLVSCQTTHKKAAILNEAILLLQPSDSNFRLSTTLCNLFSVSIMQPSKCKMQQN